MEENNNEKKVQQRFANTSGTGVISTLIFMAVTFIIMYVLSKYLG